MCADFLPQCSQGCFHAALGLEGTFPVGKGGTECQAQDVPGTESRGLRRMQCPWDEHLTPTLVFLVPHGQFKLLIYSHPFPVDPS